MKVQRVARRVGVVVGFAGVFAGGTTAPVVHASPLVVATGTAPPPPAPPPPAPPPPETPDEERGGRRTRFFIAPSLHLTIGPSFHLEPASEKNVTDVSLDATAGINLVVGPQGDKMSGFLLNPEVGYAYDALGLNAFSAKVGMGFAVKGMIALVYNPRLLVGTWQGEAIGMRNGIEMKLPLDLFSIELGHQFVKDTVTVHHQAVFLFSINPGSLFYILAKNAF